MNNAIALYAKVLEAVGPTRGIFSESWFSGNVARVVAMVCFQAGLLLNFKADATATKVFGYLLIFVSVAIMIIRVLFAKDILPL